ncbi:flagellar basal body rod protein FlgF [Allopusillimonas ginsengisoli]|uniref:flagellar basal body rod protein FlgF n=1 Tax=Allopusillimonas ginsengisoli TaxID=453575 RepID=UPI00101FA5CC|nr:flagellar basal body rod protein FlgF [Allopusillimonas ginsengisoli]TEA79412.1 flagellar basal body rod protein FlgF [Allopusillimonas ginsengisoli]
MDRMIYTAASGAARILEQQAVISHNLANIGTTGFREQISLYRSVPVIGSAGLPTRVSTVMSTPGSSYAKGSLVETGRTLDAAIAGEGWFSVQTPAGEAYTRSGEFAVNAQGVLVTQQGWPVLSEDGAWVSIPEGGAVAFSGDGQVFIQGPAGRDAQQLARLKLVNPSLADMQRSGDGTFRLAGGANAPYDPQVRILGGVLEKSNVNAASALVGMISNARHFEMQMKVIQDAGANAERANAILSVG